MDHVLLSVNYSLHRRDKKLCLSIRLASLIISAYISLPILPALLPTLLKEEGVEPEWLLEPPPTPAARVRSPGLAPGAPLQPSY